MLARVALKLVALPADESAKRLVSNSGLVASSTSAEGDRVHGHTCHCPTSRSVTRSALAGLVAALLAEAISATAYDIYCHGIHAPSARKSCLVNGIEKGPATDYGDPSPGSLPRMLFGSEVQGSEMIGGESFLPQQRGPEHRSNQASCCSTPIRLHASSQIAREGRAR